MFLKRRLNVKTSRSYDKNKPKILFLNHKKSQCGVYEFGRNIGLALEKSSYGFSYCECGSTDELKIVLDNERPDLIIYNYNPATMDWLSGEFTKKTKIPQIGIIHEVTQAVADRADNSMFDFHIAHDPTLLLKNPIVFKAGRLIPHYENKFHLPSRPTIGSFGFAGKKGHKRIVELVEKEFDSAVIRINIPFATFGDADGSMAKAIAEDCRKALTKKDITLTITHDFLEEQQLLDFLAQNTVNLFLYEHMDEPRGISATPDLALAVKRPIGITRQSMFRHVVGAKPSICIEDTSIKEIIDNGFVPLERFYNEWSEEGIRWDYERIVNEVFSRIYIRRTMLGGYVKKGLSRVKRFVNGSAQNTNPQSVSWIADTSINNELPAPLKHKIYTPAVIPGDWPLNNILDDKARRLYKNTIEQMSGYLPDLMKRKIPEANVQQAFVLDSVYKIASKIENAKMLCVGSFEDSAAESLKLLGFSIEEVDPMINYDLKTFLTKPTTKLRSYDVVFSTSVIEHVESDVEFLKQIVSLLKKGGTTILTCDYCDTYRAGDPKPVVDFRLYTQRDIMERLLPALTDCELVDEPQWDCPEPDFWYDGVNYTFASIVLRKTA